jgi:hypothetical protein
MKSRADFTSKLAAVVAFGLTAAPAVAFAQKQLVLFDEVYTAQVNDPTIAGAKFHHAVKPYPDQPASWVSPVDYSKGTIYFHLEVMSKPSKRPTVIDVCFDGDLPGYGCIDTGAYTDVGTYDSKPQALTDAYQWNKIAWAKKRTVYHLVIKDPALGGTPGGTPATDFVPSKLRIVATIVPAGGTYTPPGTMTGGGGDGGAMVADAGAAPVDAGPTPGAGAVADAASGGSAPGQGPVAPPVLVDGGPGATAPTAGSSPPGGSSAPTAGGASMSARPAPPRSTGCSLGGGGGGLRGPGCLGLALLALRSLRRSPRVRPRSTSGA